VYAAGAARVAELGCDARLPPPVRTLLLRFAHAATVAWPPAATAAAEAEEAGGAEGGDEGLRAGQAVLELKRAGLKVCSGGSRGSRGLVA
jgi:hypothetical protein